MKTQSDVQSLWGNREQIINSEYTPMPSKVFPKITPWKKEGIALYSEFLTRGCSHPYFISNNTILFREDTLS